jgi:large subunit ribosomal protein L23
MKRNFHEERLMQILVAPKISEKATYLAESKGQVAFIVLPDATKPEIKAAVELLFNAKVKAVQVTNKKGKLKRTGRNAGRQSDVRTAVVCLIPGQEINFLSPVEGA